MSVESRLQQMEQRLVAVEAELAIRNLITRYSLAADCGDAQAAMACHTEDALYIVSAPCAGRSVEESSTHGAADLRLEGRQAIGDMLKAPLHQSLLPYCAHTVGPFSVELSGDRAQAIGYSRLYRQQDDAVRLMRLSMNIWQFQCHQGQWLISQRESRLMGSDAAQRLLKTACKLPL